MCISNSVKLTHAFYTTEIFCVFPCKAKKIKIQASKKYFNAKLN